MKLYTRKQFLALPSGVVFTKEDADIDCFQIKGNTRGENDFNCKPFISLNSNLFEDHFDALLDFRIRGEANADFSDWYRDGLYEDDEMFVVLERHEVCALIASIEETLKEGYGST